MIGAIAMLTYISTLAPDPIRVRTHCLPPANCTDVPPFTEVQPPLGWVPWIMLAGNYIGKYRHIHCSVVGRSSSAASTVSQTLAMTAVMVLINNSCYSCVRGTVNGIGQTLASTARVIGPFVGGVIFAWSESNGLAWPLDYHLVWNIQTLIGAVVLYQSLLLPGSIDKAKTDPRDSSDDGKESKEPDPR